MTANVPEFLLLRIGARQFFLEIISKEPQKGLSLIPFWNPMTVTGDIRFAFCIKFNFKIYSWECTHCSSIINQLIWSLGSQVRQNSYKN